MMTSAPVAERSARRASYNNQWLVYHNIFQKFFLISHFGQIAPGHDIVILPGAKLPSNTYL